MRVYEIHSWASGELTHVCTHGDPEAAELCAIRKALNTGRTVEIVERDLAEVVGA